MDIVVNGLYVATDAKLLTCTFMNWTAHCIIACAEKMPARLDLSLLLSGSVICTVQTSR